MKRRRVKKFPRTENIHLMCPDGPHVVEGESQIQKKEENGVHLVVTIDEGEEPCHGETPPAIEGTCA
jgi:hypothetical protein